MTTPSGIEIYSAFIEAELRAEKDSRDSVNSRAATAVTSATALITLALAVIGVLVGKDRTFPACAQPFLLLSLAFLLGAGACAVAAGFPWRQRFVKARTLNKMLDAHRTDSEEDARYTVAYCNMVVLVSLRSGTTIKTRFLLVSAIFQILAIAALGACIWALVTVRSDNDKYAAAGVHLDLRSQCAVSVASNTIR
ncbi:hypothetical protein [Mycobacterium bohemicum]|uniref:hypothetical protein n=1 Tax=Mycobacterium bohemicum TaxID=56425 RepID=UPI0011123E72|nr:hypothetical protein [Mycobacterium bohemicum]MCV6972013.1 hypothetical protein [Mycobacterium bohemicum]